MPAYRNVAGVITAPQTRRCARIKKYGLDDQENISMNIRPIILFAASAAIAAAVSLPETASAVSKQYPAHACQAAEPGPYIWSDAIAAPEVYRDYYCPIIEDSALSKHDVTTLKVTGDDLTTTGQAWAKACILDTYAGSSGACGTASNSGSTAAFTGTFTLTPSRSYWTVGNAADFGYVFVHIPASAGGSYISRVAGIYYSN
ncbi:hypothetical protein [Sorangium sp. So ce385]|uniref:hypothetical protein n=1 Tax=Sorangium sp. So ce385 TaxID=3133308 RepID=UPI003F5C97C0